MKVAYFAESPADEAAVTILTEAILGRKTTPVTHAGLRHRGWPSVRNALPAVLKELHYHTDAQGFVLVVDSNGSPPHLPEHDEGSVQESKCRLCELRRIVKEVQRQVRPRANQPPVKIALGLAVPTIEGWLLCGVDLSVTEAAWINGMREGRRPYTPTQLKERLYSTSHPSLPIEVEAMKAAATRLSGNIAALTACFPQGFGALMKELRSW